ncbi:MAG: phosphoribosylamine--glycine ligase [Candidatus Limnocylindrales bacterium]
MAPARILVIGSGGREHALAWRLGRDPDVEQVFVGPGNPGMDEVATLLPGLAVADHGAVIDLARAHGVELVVVGPEAPLVAGLADALREAGIAVFGPGREGARLEGSKAFCREVAGAAGVPTADGRAFDDDPAGALAFARSLGASVVIKADGLAGGKGVTVCATLDQAADAITTCKRQFGEAGRRIVVERALVGREVSVIALTDGTNTVALPAARDHKRVGDGDTGPNTGGMGALSPVADFPDADAAALVDTFHVPILAELQRRGIEYRGALYAGVMLTADGPYLLECNVRFGDPETQVLMPRLSGALAPLLWAAAAGSLAPGRLESGDPSVGVVLAASGYPEAPALGTPIGLDRAALGDALLFWSGVALDPERGLVTDGGRVATIVGRGETVDAAAEIAYGALGAVRFDGRHVRRDIGRPTLVGAGR